MAVTLTSPSDCCETCDSPIVTELPGPQGKSAYEVAVDGGFGGTEAEWLASLTGTDGDNAFTLTAAGFTQPIVGANVVVDVANSDWMAVGQKIFVEGGGYYDVVSKPSSIQVVLENLGYDGNAAPAVVVPISSMVSPGGVKGTDGSSASGDMLGANNLSDVDDAPTSIQNLGITSTAAELNKLDGVTTTAAELNFVAGVTSAIQTQLNAKQASDAMLTALAALVSATDRYIYFTGVDAPTLGTITAFARSLLDDALASDARSTLGKLLPRYGLLCSATAVDVNIPNNDNAMTVESARYRVDKIILESATANLNVATLGVFSAPGGGGTVYAADQSLVPLDPSSIFLDLTLNGAMGTNLQTAGTIYARSGTAQGGAATVNVWMFGWKFD